MLSNVSLSQFVLTETGDRLFIFEAAARFTETSVPLIERYVDLGLIEPVGVMLKQADMTKIAKLGRLRKDLGLNIVGASMVLDMVSEISQLKAQLRSYQVSTRR